jgi:hopanoid biosynthesis associated protein HpnK
VKRIRLIVNGDDFGLSESVNEGVIRAYKEGVLTSCSLMVTGDAFDQAVTLARENPGLAVGIHLVTAMGKSVLPKREIPSLIDEEGRFSNNPALAGLKYYFWAPARREIRKELAAQFAKYQSTGLPLSHVDGHLHMHVHPVIFNAAVSLGEKFGARRMRVPQEERRLALAYDRGGALSKIVHSLLFSRLASYMKKTLSARGFRFTERVYGDLQTGKMNERYFLYALENLTSETNEIYFHPAVYTTDAPLTEEQRQQVVEFGALTSAAVIRRIDELGVELSNYFDLDLAR